MASLESTRIGELLTLARDASVPARIRLVDALGDLMFDAQSPPSEKELALATDIVRQLIADAEVAVRRALAMRLAREPRAPRSLVVALAKDEIAVAQPVLVESLILEDGDLIEVIRQRTLQHQLAIAIRRGLSEEISAALVATGHPDVIRALVENPQARIARDTFERIVDLSRELEAVQAPLVRRHDLDADLAGRMYAWVSAALRREIVLNFDVDPKLLDDAIADALQDLSRAHGGPAPAAPAASAPSEPGMLLRLLRAGEIQMFEAMLACKTGLRLGLARRAFYEPGGRPLAIACRAIGVNKADFAAIFLLARQARPGDKSVDPGELQAILAFFDALAADTARQVVASWREGTASPGPRTRL